MLAAVVAGVPLLAGASAYGVIAYDGPTRNTTAPTGGLANSGWQWQGQWAAFTGTPIAAQYFITAKHVGGTVGQSFSLNGKSYTTTTVFNDPNTDLAIWKISGVFDSYAPLYTATNENTKSIVLFGRGTPPIAPVTVDSELKGWTWNTIYDAVLSWGQNVVSGTPTGGPGVGDLLAFQFNAGATNEAMLSAGDSGGGVFINDGGTWKLAGLNYSVEAQFSYTGADGGFFAAIFDKGGLYQWNGGGWTFVNDQGTDVPAIAYATRISSRVSWINSTIPATERSEWANSAGGNWTAAGNWTGSVPNGAGHVANLNTKLASSSTITLNAAVTVGTLNFNNTAASYTIAGANTLTLNNGASAATVLVWDGQHGISAPLTLSSNVDINTSGLASALTISGILNNSSSKTINKLGTGTLTFSGAQTHGAATTLNANAGTTNLDANLGSPASRTVTVNANSAVSFRSTQHLAAVSIASGVTAAVPANGSRVLVTSTLNIAGGVTPAGRLDLSDNALVVDYTTGSPLATIKAQVISGYAAGAWNGNGIASSAAAANSIYAIGYAQSSDALGPSGGMFQGQSVDGSAVLVRYTLAGDNTLDGMVNFNDLLKLSQNYGLGGMSWFDGDTDYDGTVNFNDLLKLSQNYNQAAASADPLLPAFSLDLSDTVPDGSWGAAVPEPHAIGLLLPAAILLMRRRVRGL